ISVNGWHNGKFGNACAAIKDRSQGTGTHRSHYTQFSGGIPYRNDLFGPNTPSGNFGVWENMYQETALQPLYYAPAIVGAVGAVHPATSATVLNGTSSRNITTQVPFSSDASKVMHATLGPSGVGGVALSMHVVKDAYAVGYSVGE